MTEQENNDPLYAMVRLGDKVVVQAMVHWYVGRVTDKNSYCLQLAEVAFGDDFADMARYLTTGDAYVASRELIRKNLTSVGVVHLPYNAIFAIFEDPNQ